MKKREISVLQNGIRKNLTFDEILENHGGEMPGGAALAFRMFQWVFEEVLKTTPIHGECSFYSGLGENGRGIIDTAKQVLGVLEGESLRLDKEYSLDKEGPAAPGGGRYYFEVGSGEKLTKLAVRDGAIPKEFLEYSAGIHRKRSAGQMISEEETAHLQKLRVELSLAILEAESNDLFRIIEE